MNSFTVTAVGDLAKDPDSAMKGDIRYTKIFLMGKDFAGKDAQDNARQLTTGVWFMAFEGLGDSLAKNSRKGDQLILQTQMRTDNCTDKEGEKDYDNAVVVQNFHFGAPGVGLSAKNSRGDATNEN